MGKALHAIIASHLMNHTSASDILKHHGMAETISTQDAVESANRFETFLTERYNVKSISCELPISYKNDQGQIISGWIDLLVETDRGFIIIDHKASPRNKTEWEPIALSYSGQLHAYAIGLSKVYSKKVIETWVHFAMTGGIVKVET